MDVCAAVHQAESARSIPYTYGTEFVLLHPIHLKVTSSHFTIEETFVVPHERADGPQVILLPFCRDLAPTRIRFATVLSAAPSLRPRSGRLSFYEIGETGGPLSPDKARYCEAKEW